MTQAEDPRQCVIAWGAREMLGMLEAHVRETKSDLLDDDWVHFWRHVTEHAVARMIDLDPSLVSHEAGNLHSVFINRPVEVPE